MTQKILAALLLLAFVLASPSLADKQDSSACTVNPNDLATAVLAILGCVRAGEEICVSDVVQAEQICVMENCADFDAGIGRVTNKEIPTPDPTRPMTHVWTGEGLAYGKDEDTLRNGVGTFLFAIGPGATEFCDEEDGTTTGWTGWIPVGP